MATPTTARASDAGLHDSRGVHLSAPSSSSAIVPSSAMNDPFASPERSRTPSPSTSQVNAHRTISTAGGATELNPPRSAVRTPAATPQELHILSVTQGDATMQYHLKRLSLREKAQELANIKCEDIDIPYETIQEAVELATAGGLMQYLFDDVELGHMLMQFRQLDVNHDDKITPQDIRSLILRVDPAWAKSDDPALQSILDTSARDWIRSASVDGAAEMTFTGFVKALVRKRTEEADNYGLGEGVTVPVELMAHPFWDLRTVMCTTCCTELSGWALKRGYAIPKSSLNSWRLRYFRLVLLDGSPVLEYWDDYQASEMLNEDSLSLSFPGITRCHSSLTASRTREAAIAQTLREQSQAESAVEAALAAVDAGTRLDRYNRQQQRSIAGDNRGLGVRLQGHLNADQISKSHGPALKGSINLREVALFDFSPKTFVKLAPSTLEAIQTKQVSVSSLTVFKVVMNNGRSYALAAGEETALNWVSELIRFSNRFHAEAEWRRNWGLERMTNICLRDWLNASSVRNILRPKIV